MGLVEGADTTSKTYAVRSQRLMVAMGLGVAFLVTLSQILQPDYTTHQRAHPADYLWVVVPGALIVLGVVVRALRSRLESSPSGLRIVRTTSSDALMWDHIRRFEVRPTPNRGGQRVLARLDDERVVAVATVPWPVRGRRLAAERLAAALEADRRHWTPPVGRPAPGPPAADRQLR